MVILEKVTLHDFLTGTVIIIKKTDLYFNLINKKWFK
jgi:hypothetical protein